MTSLRVPFAGLTVLEILFNRIDGVLREMNGSLRMIILTCGGKGMMRVADVIYRGFH